MKFLFFSISLMVHLKSTIILGMQDYETDKNKWPMNKPISKLEAIYQTSGEAQYCNDIPSQPGEVFCAFVLTQIGNGQVASTDASKALAMKGVLAFYTYKDVPGKNLAIAAKSEVKFEWQDELLFVEKDILYAGQPVGVIVAETHNLANQAAQLVDVTYSEPLSRKPVITIQDVFATKDDSRIMKSNDIPINKANNKGKRV